MAKAFAKQFYSSKAWQDCRNEYAKRQQHLCEECLRQGIYRPGEIVHHIIEIDPITINKPEVALNFDNLELLCRQCHYKAHPKKKDSLKNILERFFVDDNGKVFAIDPPSSSENARQP